MEQPDQSIDRPGIRRVIFYSDAFLGLLKKALAVRSPVDNCLNFVGNYIFEF